MVDDAKTGSVAPVTNKKLADVMRVNVKLVPLKILLFFMFGALCSLYPFMTIHMKSIGLTWTEIAIIYAILPFVSCIGPPLGGALADRIGNYRLVFVGFTLLTALTHMSLWFAVPSALPKQVITSQPATDLQFNLLCGNITRERPEFFTNSIPINNTCTVNETTARFKINNCKTNCISVPLTIYFSGGNQLDRMYIDMQDDGSTNGFLEIHNNSFELLHFTFPDDRQFDSLSCSPDYLPTLELRECFVSCLIHTDFVFNCEESIPSSNHAQTLVTYTVLRFLAGIASSTATPILDAIAYQMSKEHNGDLGFQRTFTLIGMAVFPPLSGYLVQVASKATGYQNFAPPYCIFGGLFILSAAIASCMTLKVKLPAEDVVKNIARILRRPAVSIFVFMMFLTGVMWGFLENYLFVFMVDELRSPKWVLGMTTTVAALSALPVVAASTWIMKYLGHANIVTLCCILYGCRFLMYSYIYDALLILPVEILEAFTASLLWVVASVYCGRLAPDYLATLQGVIIAAHGAIGRGAGGLIGGIMFDNLSYRPTYQLFAAGCFVAALFYGIVHWFWLRGLEAKVFTVRSGETELDEAAEALDPNTKETRTPSSDLRPLPGNKEFLQMISGDQFEYIRRRSSLAIPRIQL